MAVNTIRRQVMTTAYEGTRSDPNSDLVEHIKGALPGAYTERRLNTTLSRANPGYVINVQPTNYSVAEYEMSLEDFVKYGTRKN